MNDTTHPTPDHNGAALGLHHWAVEVLERSAQLRALEEQTGTAIVPQELADTLEDLWYSLMSLIDQHSPSA